MNTIEATNYALELANHYFPSLDYVIVGAGVYNERHIPKKLKDKVTFLTTDFTEIRPSKSEVFILVRVLEHLPLNKIPDVRMVCITPDMNSSLTHVKCADDLNYLLQRDMYEVFNSFNKEDKESLYYDTHKWFTTKTTISKKLTGILYKGFCDVDNYQHIVTVSLGVNKDYTQKEKLYIPKINRNIVSNVLTVDYVLDYIVRLIKEKQIRKIVLENVIERFNISDALYLLYEIHNIMLKYNIRQLKSKSLNMDTINMEKKNIFVNYYQTYMNPEIAKWLFELEAYYNFNIKLTPNKRWIYVDAEVK